MSRVVCTLPNASQLINGVRFASLGDGGGMLSEDIPDHIADAFLGIPGYTLHEAPKGEAKGDGKKSAASAT